MNLCGFAAAGLLLSALATAELVSLMKSGGADLTDEINFFELHDTNGTVHVECNNRRRAGKCSTGSFSPHTLVA